MVEDRKSKKSGGAKLRKQKSSFGRIAEHVFGYGAKPERSTLPAGYTICYSRNGHPYLMKVNESESDGADAEAANEHRRIHYPMSVNREVLGNRFGVGIYLYFDFLMYLIGTNIILLILGVISFGIHVNNDKWGNLEGKSYGRFSFFFYDDEIWKHSHGQWLWIDIVSILCWFLFGPFYSFRIQRYFRQREQTNDGGVDLVEVNLEEYIDAEDFIKTNEHVTPIERRYRIFVSYIIFVCVLAASSIATFFLVVVSTSRRVEDLDSSSILLSAIIAMFMTMVNMAWKRVCVILTRLEKHQTWTKFRQHNTLKFFLFKMLNVLTMYASRVLVPRICPHITSIRGFCNNTSCLTSSVGVQLLFILVFDLTVQNFWEISFGWFRAKVNERRGMLGKGSNDSVRPEFDVAEEYLEVMYRQFIVYLAFAIVPLAPVLSLLCNIVEYRVDKYRLLRICQHPRGLQGSMRNFLTFFLFCTAAVALASPPYGSAWVMSGQSQSMCNYNSTATN